MRLGAKGGGCSGLSYIFDFEEKGPTEFDLTCREVIAASYDSRAGRDHHYASVFYLIQQSCE